MSYAEREHKWSPKLSTVPTAAKITERQRDLWDALHEYIRQQGGTVTSPPYASPVRIIVGKGSSLPAKLIEFGYLLHHVGSTLRTTVDGLTQSDVVEVNLPK